MVPEPEAVVGDHDREVRERAVLGGDPALEMEKEAGMGAEYDGGGVDLESALGDHLVTWSDTGHNRVKSHTPV